MLLNTFVGRIKVEAREEVADVDEIVVRIEAGTVRNYRILVDL
jgi:hypothetical protein